jgi:glycosyltransferase involved in cell wall biosynthesis
VAEEGKWWQGERYPGECGARSQERERGRHGTYDNQMSSTESHVATARVLVVVPTLGRRPAYLREALRSIREQEIPSDIVIVAPEGVDNLPTLAADFSAHLIPDPGSLPSAINLGVSNCLADHDFVTWLNDDDLLEPGSLVATSRMLDRMHDAVVAFGACRYIDVQGQELWLSKAGSWAPRILSWGPDLIPQPGMLVRAQAWTNVGGLDEGYRLAFDLDLLLRLKKLGRLVSVSCVVSSFRWHPDSLTVDDRSTNLAESERAKRASLGPIARRLTWLWERPVRVAITYAVRRINQRSTSPCDIRRHPSRG